MRGRDGVAKTFAGRAPVRAIALIEGAVGAVWPPGAPTRRLCLTIGAGKIVAIELVADPEQIGTLDLEVLQDAGDVN
jgi:RNA polymerase sigma-70 factor (ECF subfamily)